MTIWLWILCNTASYSMLVRLLMLFSIIATTPEFNPIIFNYLFYFFVVFCFVTQSHLFSIHHILLWKLILTIMILEEIWSITTKEIGLLVFCAFFQEIQTNKRLFLYLMLANELLISIPSNNETSKRLHKSWKID